MFSLRTALASCVFFPLVLSAQIPVEGVADRTAYVNQVTLRVPADPGYEYTVLLGEDPFPVATWVTIDLPDYYELRVTRTEIGTANMASRLVQFIVTDSERGGSEWGLPTHVPAPVIQSAAAEFVGASLRLLVPAAFPPCYPIPVVAWVVDAEDRAVRVNGVLEAPDQPGIQLRRGVGAGFINPASGPVSYAPQVHGLTASIEINVSEQPSWTTVGGVIEGIVNWPANARVHVTNDLTLAAGAELTIQAGAVVRLDSGVDITNNGSFVIEGTLTNPVVLMPTVAGQPWGGFIMRHGTGEVRASGTIFTGSGAVPNWFNSNGNPNSHRLEQALFYVEDGQTVELSDSAAIDLAGQLGQSPGGGLFVLTRFLTQRCTTAGQYSGATLIVNDSAFIECPVDSAAFEDGDNDAFYLSSGVHCFTNTLIGWTKDDGVDSGADGVGTLTFDHCWFEALFHEGNALSGSKTVLVRDTVYLDCGQGLEDGYGGSNARAEDCLFVACQSGARHGDNYPNIGAYTGTFTLTNSVLLNNHRDVFAFNWRSTGWTNAYGQMLAQGNWLTTQDPNFPDNMVWDPVADAPRLARFGAAGHVGMGLALWPGAHRLDELRRGVPVGLSRFSTNTVRVDYQLQATDGFSALGALEFLPGQIRGYVPVSTNFVGVLRVSLSAPENADLTGPTELFLQQLPPAPGPPRVEVGQLGSWIIVYWRDPSWRLERSSAVDGTWAEEAGASPRLVSPSGAQFYRLRIP